MEEQLTKQFAGQLACSFIRRCRLTRKTQSVGREVSRIIFTLSFKKIQELLLMAMLCFFSTSKDFQLLIIIFVFVFGPFLERVALAVLLIYPIYLNACSKSSSGIPIGQKVKFEVQTLYYRVRQHYYKLQECFKIE